MTEPARTLTRHDLEAKIVKRCWEDEKFRKEFVADPAGAFVKYLEVPAARLPRITVHQETPGSWHIVLPAKLANANELSQEDLEKVAGGTINTIFILSFGSVTSVASVSVTVSAGETLKQGW